MRCDHSHFQSQNTHKTIYTVFIPYLTFHTTITPLHIHSDTLTNQSTNSAYTTALLCFRNDHHFQHVLHHSHPFLPSAIWWIHCVSDGRLRFTQSVPHSQTHDTLILKAPRVSMGNNTLSDVAAPQESTDAANRACVAHFCACIVAL